MNDMSLSHYLMKGTKLVEVVTTPDPQYGCAIYKVSEESHQAKDITVVEECGQMGMVPWARIELNNGDVRLVNLAAAESVVILSEKQA